MPCNETLGLPMFGCCGQGNPCLGWTREPVTITINATGTNSQPLPDVPPIVRCSGLIIPPRATLLVTSARLGQKQAFVPLTEPLSFDPGQSLTSLAQCGPGPGIIGLVHYVITMTSPPDANPLTFDFTWAPIPYTVPDLAYATDLCTLGFPNGAAAFGMVNWYEITVLVTPPPP